MAEPSLALAWTLLGAGLVLIAAEFLLPTVFVGFVGAAVSFAGIWLSAEGGVGSCLLFSLVFILGLTAEFVLFRRLLRSAPITNRVDNQGAAVPSASGYALYVGRQARTLTVLAPSGAVEIDGVRVEAFSADGYVERGAAVVVTEAAAGRVTVRISR
ncbi:MAG: NfeD family protein [Opitutales bacterium]|jgi:membrane-bound serine protease (ClpP class)